MKRILLLLFSVFCIVTVNAQYRYKNLEVTASSRDGSVAFDGKYVFTLSDSIVDIQVMMSRRSIAFVNIVNKSRSVVGVQWKNFDIDSDVPHYYPEIDKSFIDNPMDGIQNIYIGGSKGFNIVTHYINIEDTFLKKKDSKASLSINFVINNESRWYTIDFFGKII